MACYRYKSKLKLEAIYNIIVGGLAFADDVKMLSPTLFSMQLMYNIYELSDNYFLQSKNH